MRTSLLAALGVALIGSLAPRPARAQCDSCRIISATPGGGFVLEIGGQRFRAMTEAQQQRLLTLAARVERAESLLVLKDSLLAGNERLLAAYDSTLGQQRAYTATLDSLYHGYKDLAAGYRRLGGEPILTVELGAGVTGSDTEPALLAGVGLWRLRLWGFFQEANAGAAAGVSWRLF